MHRQGTEVIRHTVIPRVLIFIYDHEQVLLLEGAPTKRIWPGLYNGIGGHLEPEESVLECARRELKEECGLDGIQLDLCGVIQVDTSSEPGILLFVFKGDYNAGKIMSSAEGSLHWINTHNLIDVPVVPDLLELIPRVTNWNSDDPIFFGRYFYSGDELITHFH